MNADRFLAHYERIADAFDAVPRLRRFILDLAVRGMLVEQDSTDEPALELLKRIAAEKARLVKAGKVKKKASIPSSRSVEQAFPIPATWTFVRLVEISNIVMGQSPPGLTYNTHGEGMPLINGPVEFSEQPFGKTVANQYTTAPTNSCDKGDFLICVRGSTTGRSNIAAFDACIGRGVAAIQPLFDDGFVRLFIWSMREQIIKMGRGIAFPSITRNQLEDLPIPLPPLAEQRRIVAKVDELMELCDRRDAAQAEREATRDRLTAASLARLDTPDPDPAMFRVHAAFALENLAPLTARLDQIKALRQTILNLAVRGKLVEQDPEEEPASELLKRIGAEKARLVKAREIKKPKPSLSIDEPPFDLPANWCWALLGEISAYIQRGKSPKYTAADGSPVVSQKCVQWDGLDLTVAKLVTLESLEKYDQIRVLRDGDLLWNSTGTGTIGRVIRLLRPQPKLVCDSHVTVVRCLLADPEYVRTWLRTDYVYGVIEERAAGSTNQVELTAQMANGQPVPLPPLAEQHRIAAKVDELMALCDRLKASLATSDDTRRRTLDALLHDALAPASREMEAPE